MVKKRRVAGKPDPSKRTAATEADQWIQGAGIDPEVQNIPISPASENVSDRIVKSKSPEHQKVTLYLTKALHKRLKAHSALEDMEMSDAAEMAIAEWLDSQAAKHSDS